MNEEEEAIKTNKKILKKLIDDMNEKRNHIDLSDDYLMDNGHPCRDEVGIGEYAYGITMVPVSWVLPYLVELLGGD